jgi:hypothetical protein
MITVSYLFYDCELQAVETKTRPGNKFWDGDCDYFIKERILGPEKYNQTSNEKGPWRVKLNLEPL